MAANGISTHLPKSARPALKLALAQTARSSVPITITDNGIIWTQEIYEPQTYKVPVLASGWASSTAYALNSYINVNGVFYKCTTAGTTGVAPPAWIPRSFEPRPLDSLDPTQITPPRPTPLVVGRPWTLGSPSWDGGAVVWDGGATIWIS